MTIRKAKQRVSTRKQINKVIEYIVAWVIILITTAILTLPVHYAVVKYWSGKQEKTHVTILLDGEKIILEDVDVLHIEEE